MSAPNMLKVWANKNKCPNPSEISFKKKDVSCETYNFCGVLNEEVTLCTIKNGGHCWPGRPCFTGASYTVNASEMIIDFFLRKQLKE